MKTAFSFLIKCLLAVAFIIFWTSQDLNAATLDNLTKSQVQQELLGNIQKEGFINQEQATVITNKYIINDQKTTNVVENTASWTDYLSWINLLKTVGVMFFIVAFWGIISKMSGMIIYFIIAVPKILYQSVFFVGFSIGIVKPDLLFGEHKYYFMLFSSIALPSTLLWIVSTYENALKFLFDFFNKWREDLVLCFWGTIVTIYFGTLAFVYDSQILGFAATVFFSVTISLYVISSHLIGHSKMELNNITIGFLITLGMYQYAHYYYGSYTVNFNVGMQYYLAAVTSVCMLMNTSPIYSSKLNRPVFFFLFTLLAFWMGFSYHMLNDKAMSTIVVLAYFWLLLEWLFYVGFKKGIIIGSLLSGSILYGASMVFEKYGHLIYLKVS